MRCHHFFRVACRSKLVFFICCASSLPQPITDFQIRLTVFFHTSRHATTWARIAFTPDAVCTREAKRRPPISGGPGIGTPDRSRARKQRSHLPSHSKPHCRFFRFFQICDVSAFRFYINVASADTSCTVVNTYQTCSIGKQPVDWQRGYGCLKLVDISGE